MASSSLIPKTRCMNSYAIESAFSDGSQVWLRQLLDLKRIELVLTEVPRPEPYSRRRGPTRFARSVVHVPKHFTYN